jgi:hypothetical protein
MHNISGSKSLERCTSSPLCSKCSTVLIELEQNHDILEEMYRDCNHSRFLVDSALSRQVVLCPTTLDQARDSAQQCHLCALIALHCAGNTIVPHDRPVSISFHPGEKLFSAVTSDDKVHLKLGIQCKYAWFQTSATFFFNSIQRWRD